MKYNLGNIFIPVMLTIFVLTIYVVPSYAQGKSNQAPGQNKSETQNDNSNKGKKEDVVVGRVENVTDNKVVVEDKKDKSTKEAIVDSTTKVIGTSKKPITLKSIKQNDKVAIVSTPNGELATDSGKPKKALKIFVKDASQSAVPKKRAMQGVITNITGSLLTLAHQIHRERVTNVQVPDGVEIKLKGITDATLASLQVGQRIVVMGDFQADGTFVVRRIHVIPGKATGIFNKQPVATPSGSLTVTPTATASATPSATPTLFFTPTPTATSSPTPTPTPTPTP